MVYDAAPVGSGAEYGPTFDLVLALDGDDLYAPGGGSTLLLRSHQASAHQWRVGPQSPSTIATSQVVQAPRRGTPVKLYSTRSRACCAGSAL